MNMLIINGHYMRIKKISAVMRQQTEHKTKIVCTVSSPVQWFNYEHALQERICVNLDQLNGKSTGVISVNVVEFELQCR